METFVSQMSYVVDLPFKSYYVVWKLIHLIQIKSTDLWFKSYYVVWKPAGVAKNALAGKSLNRTM